MALELGRSPRLLSVSATAALNGSDWVSLNVIDPRKDPAPEWFQVIASNQAGAYRLEVRWNTLTLNCDIIGANVYHGAAFKWAPDLWVRIAGQQTGTYLIAVN